MNEEARTHLTRARIALYIESPFYGVLLMRLVLIENPAVKTLCVNNTTIFYNPDFVLGLTPNVTKAALAHEVGHLILDHLDRRAGRRPKKWNAACDYVVNAGLKIDGFEIGADWLFNPAFADMTSEHVYSLLPEQEDGGGSKGNGDGWGALDEMHPSADPAAVEANATEWQVAAIQAANIAKGEGKLPASMDRFIEEIRGEKVDWRQRLRRFATQNCKSDFSWARPQRRMVPYGYYLPSLYSEAVGLLADVIDTSGSIDDYVLSVFGAEMIAIWDAVKPEKMVNIYCDAKVQNVTEFGSYDRPTFASIKGAARGGGGTSFIPPFVHIEREGLKPSCLIYLTDGYGDFPEEPPPYPVMWVMTTNVVAPWGETIRIES